jgi:hypothetical protein
MEFVERSRHARLYQPYRESKTSLQKLKFDLHWSSWNFGYLHSRSAMSLNTEKIDDTVLALFVLTLHDGYRA